MACFPLRRPTRSSQAQHGSRFRSRPKCQQTVVGPNHSCAARVDLLSLQSRCRLRQSSRVRCRSSSHRRANRPHRCAASSKDVRCSHGSRAIRRCSMTRAPHPNLPSHRCAIRRLNLQPNRCHATLHRLRTSLRHFSALAQEHLESKSRKKPEMLPKPRLQPAGTCFSWPPRFYSIGRCDWRLGCRQSPPLSVPQSDRRGCRCRPSRTSHRLHFFRQHGHRISSPGVYFCGESVTRPRPASRDSGPAYGFPFLCPLGGMCYKRASEAAWGWSRQRPGGRHRRSSPPSYGRSSGAGSSGRNSA
jgi:hypothetical protein